MCTTMCCGHSEQLSCVQQQQRRVYGRLTADVYVAHSRVARLRDACLRVVRLRVTCLRVARLCVACLRVACLRVVRSSLLVGRPRIEEGHRPGRARSSVGIIGHGSKPYASGCGDVDVKGKGISVTFWLAKVTLVGRCRAQPRLRDRLTSELTNSIANTLSERNYRSTVHV